MLSRNYFYQRLAYIPHNTYIWFMKSLTTLCLVLFPIWAFSQVFNLEMDVLESGPRGSRCYEQISVSYAVQGDTIGFHYNEVTLLFFRFKLNQQQHRAIADLNKNSLGEHVMVKSMLGDTFLLRVFYSDEGMIVFLNNLDDRREHYMLDYTETKLCETNIYQKK